MGNLTVKESGEMVNIISPNVNNITSFKVHFSPKQEGTGDPSPENVREIVGWNGVEGYKCGKNMAHIVGYSAKSMNNPYASRFLTNNYGTTINTIEPINEVIVTQSTWDDSKDKWHYNNGYLDIIDDNLVFGQWYKISFKVTNIINNPLNCSLSNIRVLTPKGSGFNVYIDGDYVYTIVQYLPITSLPERHHIEIRNCGMSFTMSDFMVTAVDNEDYIYEPFQYGTVPINWSTNIKKWTYTDIIVPDNYSTNNFNGYGNNLWDNIIEDIPSEWFGKSLTYSVYIDRAESPYNSYDDARVWFYGDSTTMKEASSTYRITEASSSGRSWVTFTIPDGTTKLALGLYLSKGSRAYNPQLEFGELPTDYQSYVGNIYGGYVDLVTGEIVQTYHCYQITGQETFTNVGSNWVSIYVSPQGMQASLTKNGFCTHYPYSPYTKDAIGVMFNEHTVTFDQRIGDATYWKNFCTEQYNNGTPVTLVYEIKTPFTAATLSPTQLSTLKGQNNFWSNADYVEIEYELTETFDIQKTKRKIILNQPHVESTSGTIAKPETDMIGKIKECKIHFMPVQQGDSDPTPDNIVPITGWTGIDVYQAFVEYPITPMVNTTTGYGVKWVVDKDGLMTAYGTPTAYTGAVLGAIDVNGDETLYGAIAGSLNNVTFNKPTLLDSNGKNVVYTAGDGILQTGLDLSLYSDIKKIRVPIKRSGNVFMSGSCNAIIWKDKKPTIFTTTIDWTDIAGTIYGGYVDLISGELVVTQTIIKDKWGNWEQNGVLDNHVRKTHDFQYRVKGGSASQYCLSNVTSNYVWSNSQDTVHYYAASTGRLAYMILPTDFDENTDVEVVGTLVEPITYQLTSQQLTTLRGINNIWSSANGEVEIKYWKH